MFDTTAARALLDRPTARTVLNRFGASIPEGTEDTEDTEDTGEPASDADEPLADESEEEPYVPKLGGFEVMNRTIDIAQAALARHTLAAYPPDLLIEVPRSACRGLEFHRAAEVIDIGRALAARALDTLDSPDMPDPDSDV
jgi:NTE family protein